LKDGANLSSGSVLATIFDELIEVAKAMTIGLINLYSTRNLGDAAIYAALAKMSPHGKVTGMLDEENPTLIRGFTASSSLQECSSFISVGGDIFNNARPKLVTRRFLSNLHALNTQRRRTLLFGQSIPRSCKGLSFALLANSIKKIAAAVVRDEESYKRLRQAHVSIELSYDTAFVLKTNPSATVEAISLFSSLGLEPSKTAVISLRNESSMYGESGSEKQLITICKNLSARGHQIALVIQADGDSADTDRLLATRIQKACPKSVILDPFLAIPPLEPWALLTAIFAIANIVVAVRYHAAILRLITGRKCYVLHYSNKGSDLCQRLGLAGTALGGGVDDHLIKAIEATGQAAFDPTPYARDVHESFVKGLALASA
jgi:polysaccharide pyruvyl transferase WcaK-like protein